MAALRRASGIHTGTAKTIVSNFCEGRSYAHLTLADLDVLGCLLYARLRVGVVAVASSAVPLAALPADGRHGSISGAGVTFERVVASGRTAAAAWPTELALERDAPDQMLVRFLRAAPPRGVPDKS